MKYDYEYKGQLFEIQVTRPQDEAMAVRVDIIRDGVVENTYYHTQMTDNVLVEARRTAREIVDYE